MSGEIVDAAPEQVFEGHAVGAGGKACCGSCRRTVREGDRIIVYAYRMSDMRRWSVAQLSCRSCSDLDVLTPTLGATEVVMNARLAVTADAATQESRLTIRAPQVTTFSAPEEGREA
ncbi:hypothetical protein [Halosimplex pelagicum]|uniref:DUF8112 domain-containing protein n=1 Tax=Halosimplex pelagicum TaxID=869886 RepID=A0A7D5TA33_9EURY|nr:hypothetical protein [Halosimplex pelagicum]QLH80989.1 hypothetical protein HZS54_04765 [Halosimplex pelagicum]